MGQPGTVVTLVPADKLKLLLHLLKRLKITPQVRHPFAFTDSNEKHYKSTEVI